LSRVPRYPLSLALATLATVATMLTLDLLWLGLVMRGVYHSALGTLERPEPFLPAAGLFYALYISAIMVYAVRPADRPSVAARRGAGLGLVAYATYELTNWAVLRDWPALLVPLDVAWGVVLTAVAAFIGKVVYDKLAQGRGVAE
jgi:uncharacterized membrane protein